MDSISIRRGKLAPSIRKKPAGAFGAFDTNWRVGIDAPSYKTTYGDSCNRAGEAIFEPKKTVAKNVSNEVFCENYRHAPSDPWLTTIARKELTKSIHTAGYSPRRPREGFDRLTANRTNYSLGNHERNFLTATAALQTKHPKKQPPVEQASIGGSTLSNGFYRLDALAQESIQRGGGGGEGVLGVQFDIVTGKPDPDARRKIAMRSGPRKTLNNVEKEELHPTDPWGDALAGRYVNIVTCCERGLPEAPKSNAKTVLREDSVLGRTRPW